MTNDKNDYELPKWFTKRSVRRFTGFGHPNDVIPKTELRPEVTLEVVTTYLDDSSGTTYIWSPGLEKWALISERDGLVGLDFDEFIKE